MAFESHAVVESGQRAISYYGISILRRTQAADRVVPELERFNRYCGISLDSWNSSAFASNAFFKAILKGELND